MGTFEDRLQRIEEKLDSLAISIEHRITAVEVKTGLYGVLGGVIVTAISAFVQYSR